MSDTIYWAVKLNGESIAKLVSRFPPVHPRLYAEHMTIVFQPSEEQERTMLKDCGKSVDIMIAGYAEDDKGQAVLVHGVDRLDSGTPHITISCADGVSPVYSNKLISSGWDVIPGGGTLLTGTIARFTRSGWDESCESLKEEDVSVVEE